MYSLFSNAQFLHNFNAFLDSFPIKGKFKAKGRSLWLALLSTSAELLPAQLPQNRTALQCLWP